MRPSQTFHVLEKLLDLPTAPLRRKGVELSIDDDRVVREVYLQWLSLMYDLGYLPPVSLKRDIRRLWTDMVQADVYDLNSAMAECLNTVRVQRRKGFKVLCGSISPHLYHLVIEDFELVLKDDVNAAKRLVQLFSYTGRLSLNDIDLTQQLLDDYLHTESIMYDDFPENVITALNKILRKWLGTYVPGQIVPKHGPGGIAEQGRCAIQTKYELLRSDGMLTYAFGEPWWVGCDGRQSRRSKTIFVPKSYKTFRTISMEPATLQYFQQGVWNLIENQVHRNSYLRNHIGFRDQSRNRKLAMQGSVNRDYATIDLSSASDSVSYSLVKKLFRGTWLLRYIVTTRSKETLLPDGRVVQLRKYAPMGSSLCFPVETLIFAALCEHVTRVNHVIGKYSVFGDDIIVPTQCAQALMRLLGVLGFRVNYDKSFYLDTCWFRESCGGEYCDGFDVTPMRVSRKYASRNDDERFRKLIDKANEAYHRGYRVLRYFYLSKLNFHEKGYLFSPTSVLSDNYTNYHLRKRWSNRYQRIEVRAISSKTTYNDDEFRRQDELIRYRHWLEVCYGRLSPVADWWANKRRLDDASGHIVREADFESIVCRPVVVLRETWMQKPFELSDQQLLDLHLGRTNK